MLKIINSDLDIVAVRRSQYPNNGFPEFLLLGRSNVGKSSFINTIINRKNLARTSSIPGKTQTLNFYLINKPRNEEPLMRNQNICCDHAILGVHLILLNPFL